MEKAQADGAGESGNSMNLMIARLTLLSRESVFLSISIILGFIIPNGIIVAVRMDVNGVREICSERCAADCPVLNV